VLLNRWRWFRERGWHEIDAATYNTLWQTYGGSVATHPQIIQRLSNLVDMPVRYLGWQQDDQLTAAIACWDNFLALSRNKLKKIGKKSFFDLGNAEIILPVADSARMKLRHNARYISQLNQADIINWRTQKEQLTKVKSLDEFSSKSRNSQRRKLKTLLEEGGQLKPVTDFTPSELAKIYCDLFYKRWQFTAPGSAKQPEVFTLLRDFMTGSIILFNDEPIAIHIIYRVESPKWISMEFVNGGVDPQERNFSPGTVLHFANIQAAWEEANNVGKDLRFSFGRADREYKDRWCNRIPVGFTN